MDSETLNEQWARICAQVKSYQDIDPSQVSAFFSRLVPQAMSDSFLMLTADNDFIKTWVEQHYTEVIVRALRDLTGVVFAVAIAVDPTQEQRKSAAVAQPSPAAPLSAPSQPMPAPAPAQPAATTMEPLPSQPIAASAPPPPAYGAPLSQAAPFEPSGMVAHPLVEDVVVDHYAPPAPAPLSQEPVAERSSNPSSSLTFESFVIGESNRMAYSMAVEVAESPGRLPLNPLFIYGKSGLGKTHLMRAIQNYIEETRPSMRAVYVDAQDFVSKYSEAGAIKDQEKVSFRNFRAYYEQADILLLDDVQHLQGKKESMNMLFQLFNTLTSQGKQVVLSADRAPKIRRASEISLLQRRHHRYPAAGSGNQTRHRQILHRRIQPQRGPGELHPLRRHSNVHRRELRIQHPRAQGRREYRHLSHDLLRSQRYLH